MQKTIHYCDKCHREIKHFFIGEPFIPIVKVTKNEYDDITQNGDSISIWLHVGFKNYELCGKCYKDLKRFIEG